MTNIDSLPRKSRVAKALEAQRRPTKEEHEFGTVVLATVYYTDTRGSKRRPVVLMNRTTYGWAALPLTSRRSDRAFKLRRSTQAGLHADCYFAGSLTTVQHIGRVLGKLAGVDTVLAQQIAQGLTSGDR